MKNPIVIIFKRPENQFIELNLEDLYYQNDNKRQKNMTVIKKKNRCTDFLQYEDDFG